MRKRKSKAEKLAEQRILRAVGGFQIPIAKIPDLHKALSEAIAAGKSDEELKALVAAFPGVLTLTETQKEVLRRGDV